MFTCFVVGVRNDDGTHAFLAERRVHPVIGSLPYFTDSFGKFLYFEDLGLAWLEVDSYREADLPPLQVFPVSTGLPIHMLRELAKSPILARMRDMSVNIGPALVEDPDLAA